MSDPPQKKIGSLRDRIAQFENKGPASTPGPPPKPKPAGVANRTWKPRSPSPETSAGSTKISSGDLPSEREGADVAKASMNAADAKQAIGQTGGSLKDRMAALQGMGAFGVPAPGPIPKPTADKPKWKPTPPPVQNSGEERGPMALTPPLSTATQSLLADEATKSPPLSATIAPPGENEKIDSVDVGAAESENDPEEEERQRRAAIAARMAKLGGARVGMGPPIFGRKPDVPPKRKTSDEEKLQGTETKGGRYRIGSVHPS
jgi:myosin tail region-interacting protein MTI1